MFPNCTSRRVIPSSTGTRQVCMGRIREQSYGLRSDKYRTCRFCLVSSPSPLSPIPWFDDIQGVAYRYYDLRMNVAPLIADQKQSLYIWQETIHWWLDHTIKIRFVESDGDGTYWFIMGAQTQRPSSNLSFYKNLPISDNYERFKKGHDGEAYLRLGVYKKKALEEAKGGEICKCGHEASDHDENDNDACLYKVCDCKEFVTFQVTLSRRKKTVTDIEFISESDEEAVRGDPLVWNCMYTHKYSKES